MISNIIATEMTPELTYLRGEYALWNYKIPYFSTVLPMKFIVEKFSLVDEIQGAESIEWSIHELFQRDISWDRIDDELVKYLRNENHPQFFNSLTVALLPITGTGLADSYENTNAYDGMNDDTLEDPIQIGGVQIQSYAGSEDSAGKLRWDVSKIVAVAVDGQHRLAAMKRLSNQVDMETLNSSKVPVILLIPDERAGYHEPAQPRQNRSVIASLRRVFIDLNKNARQVSRARNILLDDLEIPSVCLKTLIGEKLSEEVENNRLPLAVVDWISEKNKFESGPFVTTILTLYDFVIAILRGDGNFSLTGEDCPIVKTWLQNQFSVNEEELEKLMGSVKQCYRREVPLTFKPEEVEILRRRFTEKWAPSIVSVFRDLAPYKSIIDYGAEHGLHRPEFVNLYIAEEVTQGEHGRQRSETIRASIKLDNEAWMYEQDYTAHLANIDNIKENNWAFKVVFQRALFSSYAFLYTQSDEFVAEGLSETDRIVQFTDVWIEAINRLFESGLGTVEARLGNDKLWAGIGLSAEGNIEFTKVAVTRISNWLNVWITMYRMSEVPTYKQLHDSEEGGLVDICRSAINRSGIVKLVKARDEEGLGDEEFPREVEKQTKRRYDEMRKKVHNQ